ncbi:ribosome hibernation-promoting factor, HPF/YfiA family [Herbiconiux sp. L3-i23]|uniref:ribosome hibernation-promoting factor, HPF/YfiA family n=1 Tax=Herbiconiux sp. L3-i23 TaxID=2905871 RepID=UPI0020497900|nr:ribosome-associated translation inhibitor RaiA [Herbiconiux sp. L3-i23]BDI21693.1 ribosomal subunit interface protein [Herbiconiux sp. L3-i23]
MDITITGRGAGITDRFRGYVEEKAEKVEQLAERTLSFEVRLCRHHATNGTSGDDRVELTLIGPGPIVRAEAGGGDKYAAFDIAFDKLLERLRRAKDRRKVHKGSARLGTVRAVDHRDFRVGDIQPADSEVLRRVDPETGSIALVPEAEQVDGTVETRGDDYSPVVIRHKVFSSTPMSVDDALYYMELVGHDFYLFIDEETTRPSVVYRRKGWDYGVIHLDEAAAEHQETVTAARAMAR